MSSKVKVAVRVRPLNRREIDLGAKVVVDMDDTQTILVPPSSRDKKSKNFAFDHCFWSIDSSNSKYAAQDKVYQCLGSDVLQNAFEGYNACIFAYGQTGSGKTYTMMGAGEDKGIIPRLCDNLFTGISQNDNHDITYKVEVSYIEIYNEKVRDLLCPKGGNTSLRVREHKVMGPYVEGLTKLVVSSFEDIEAIMMEGNKSRTVAATRMNTESSRSHAVFNIVLARTEYDHHTESIGEKVSKMSLVDLAGSERASKTGAEGERLKEGSNINRSLVTLGQVISSLADQSAAKHKKGLHPHFVPYRDSVLTWLLKDNLGGNSRTVMVATISPSADNYEETLSTLRYADRAKKIVNHAVVNEDPNARIIRELRDEVERLKHLLQSKISGIPTPEETGALEIQELISENENLMKECTMSWEQKEKKTEQIQQARHKALEDMGISIQSSGIAVEKSKFYLVNLNADPAMNELLVYYLKDHTKVGRLDANHTPDIQLGGLGILSEHCAMDIEDNEVCLTPMPNARTFINGRDVKERTLLRHGDRILWGNNHFFRINCPRPPGSSKQQPEQQVDFMSAQHEIMMNEIGQGPLHETVKALEEQHQAEKEGALEKQRLMYEEKIEELRKEVQMNPFGSRSQIDRTSSVSSFSSGYGSRMSWYEDRDLNQSQYDPRPEQRPLVLKEEVLKANTLAREANQLSEEMGKDTDFAVTLQIPTSSLSFGRSRSGFSSEVAIVVKHKTRGTQIWSLDKLSNKIYDMRELYNQCIEEGVPFNDKVDDTDLFFEVECHTLIGVCNVFLECLLHDVNHAYAAPIISQQGEVCGRLKVEVSRVTDDNHSDTDSEASSTDGRSSPDEIDELMRTDDDDEIDILDELRPGSIMTVGVRVIEAFDLPPALCNYVFCQYQLWRDKDTVVVPPINASISHPGPKTNKMIFENKQLFDVEVTEEFLEYTSEGSLAIEVWGNRSNGFDSHNKANWNYNVETPQKGLQDRWSELVRKMEMWVEIHELNDQGLYAPVELQTRVANESGGIFQLRQGHSRRLVVKVSPIGRSGSLPMVCNMITSVHVGSVCVRNKNQLGLDSYQEKDLSLLREKWSNSLMKRREYLDDQIHSSINNPDKSVVDKERESWLIDQWVCLTEERNAVLCPLPGSGIPGAPPTEESLTQNVEPHIPVIFLDLNDDFRNGCVEDVGPAGVDTTLSFENPDNMVELPIIKYDQKQVSATASWDSSIHDSIYLNRITGANERIYLIVKAIIRLSSPVAMDLVLRKRVCVRIYKKQSWKDSLLRKITRDVCFSCGVVYELVSHIPRQPGEETEERASLAQMAAQAVGEEEEDETVLRRYSKGISNVESLLALDKLRQEVVVKEKLAAVGKPLRKFASTPNLAAVSDLSLGSSPGRFESPEISRYWDLKGVGRSEYHIASNLSFSDSRASRGSGRDDILIDFSTFVSPPNTSVPLSSSPIVMRDNSTKRNPNSRPSSLILELETLDENDRSTSPSPLVQAPNLFNFSRALSEPSGSTSEPSEGTMSPSSFDDLLRERTASSDTIIYDEPPMTPYEDLPTPTPFGISKPLELSATNEIKLDKTPIEPLLLKSLDNNTISKRVYNVGKTKKTNLSDLQLAFTEKMEDMTLDSPDLDDLEIGESLIFPDATKSTSKKAKPFDDLFSLESIKAELEKSKPLDTRTVQDEGVAVNQDMDPLGVVSYESLYSQVSNDLPSNSKLGTTDMAKLRDDVISSSDVTYGSDVISSSGVTSGSDALSSSDATSVSDVISSSSVTSGLGETDLGSDLIRQGVAGIEAEHVGAGTDAKDKEKEHFEIKEDAENNILGSEIVSQNVNQSELKDLGKGTSDVQLDSDSIDSANSESVDPVGSEKIVESKNIGSANSEKSGPVSSEKIDLASSEKTDLACSEKTDLASSEKIDLASSEKIDLVSSEKIDLASSEKINFASSEKIDLANSEKIELVSSEKIDLASSEKIDPIASSEKIDPIASSEKIDPIASSEKINLPSSEKIDSARSENIDLVNSENIDLASSKNIDLASSQNIDSIASSEKIDLPSSERISPIASSEKIDLPSSEKIDSASSKNIDLVSSENIDPISSSEKIDLPSSEKIDPASSKNIDLASSGNTALASSIDRLDAASVESEGSASYADYRDDLSIGSREDLAAAEDWDESVLANLHMGMAIEVGKNKTGLIRYIGPTEFSPGAWIGVELDKPGGKNDGSVQGVRYFACKPRFGSFVRPDKVKAIPNSARERTTSRRNQSRDGPARSSSVRGLDKTESTSRSSLVKTSAKTRTESPSRGSRRSEGSGSPASGPAGRASSSSGSPVVKRENSTASRKKNDWKRKSNILF